MLNEKIEALFSYRMFPQLYELSGASSQNVEVFHNRLVKLQAAIYYLDAHLETNWEVDFDVINEKWDYIYACLNELKVSGEKAKYYCRQIQKYQTHELNMRAGRWPDRYNLEYFYFFKSCDVKLMRQLIFDEFPKLRPLFLLSEWRLFDLVTEVNDDVEDIFEDLSTINGNRFLIQTLKEGKGKTASIFKSFLDQLETRNIAENYRNKAWSESIREATTQNIIQTHLLIEEKLGIFTNDNGQHAAIFPYLKVG